MHSLIRVTLLQWLRSPGRVALCLYPTISIVLSILFGILFTEYTVSSDRLIAAPFISVYFIVILGVGIISREREDGVLASVFARPIYRSTYVFSKWLALFLGAWAGTLLFIALQALIILGAIHQIDLIEILRLSVESGFLCLGLSATMVAYSTVAPTYGDICLYASSWMGLAVMASFTNALAMAEDSFYFMQSVDLDYLNYIQNAITLFLLPQISLLTSPHLWPSMILAYTSNILAALLVSIFFLNRKEISYGG